VNGKENYNASNGPFFFLHEGQQYDLKNRRVIEPALAKTKVPAKNGKAASKKATKTAETEE